MASAGRWALRCDVQRPAGSGGSAVVMPISNGCRWQQPPSRGALQLFHNETTMAGESTFLTLVKQQCCEYGGTAGRGAGMRARLVGLRFTRHQHAPVRPRLTEVGRRRWLVLATRGRRCSACRRRFHHLRRRWFDTSCTALLNTAPTIPVEIQGARSRPITAGVATDTGPEVPGER